MADAIFEERRLAAIVGPIETWVDLLDVSPPLVSFRWTFVFGSDGSALTSDSTLRFRQRTEIADSVRRAGFVIEDIRGRA